MEWQPISDQSRISIIDILRGVAVFGIFFVNIVMMSSPDIFYQRAGVLPEESSINYAVRLMIDMFFTGKFYPILSFLFGFGFFIFMQRAEVRGIRVYPLFMRRMLLLLALGVLHLLLLWSGDVLHTYALLGLVLMMFYRRRAKTAFRWAVWILVLYFSLFSLAFLQPADEAAATMAAHYQQASATAAASTAMYQSEGNYAEWFVFRLQNEVLPNLAMEFITYPCIFAMMLFGFYFGKTGVFADVLRYAGLFRALRKGCGAIGLTLAGGLAVIRLRWIDLGVFSLIGESLLIYLSGIFLSFFYISVVVLMYRRFYGQKLLYPFLHAGQMAMTNYLGQSFISFAVFAGAGFYGKFDFLVCIMYCLEVILLQLAFSIWWMRRFRFGPVEWVWRRLTYGGLGSWKKGTPGHRNF
ncbi:DUF418 domain-containing protein [Paenibacillus sp. NPDC056579]|uniref:DUF418 domain-containing protein n=1 Tax=Paenibacillus sp. NPDC056579 TaxID=3345871 RepID=UPI0036CE7038